MRTVSLILVGLIVLSGCGLSHEQQTTLEMDRILNEKRLAVDSTRELDPIRNKLWMGGFGQNPPLRMLSLSEKATEVEKPAIEKWHEITLAYYTKFAAVARQYTPTLAAAIETAQSEMLSLIVDLYSQNLSYGEYNRKSRERSVKLDEQLSALELEESRTQSMKPRAPQKKSFQCFTSGNYTYCD